ncbi:MAG: hypothetical protein LUQ67_01405 [Methanomicrobiales archaeon]|nr:hypothetical protein [Methanomicrobiales archaeon]
MGMQDRGMGSRDRSRGMTVVELLVIVAIVAGGVAVGLFWESTGRGGKAPSGIIPLSVEAAERTMVVAGEVYGYWIQDGTAGGVPVSLPGGSRPEIDALSIPIQLIVGQGPVDMGPVTVEIRYRGAAAVLHRDETGLPGRGSWVVTGKTGVIPLQAADRDDILEEPETFLILVVPPGPLDPGDHVTVAISAPPGIPLVVDRDIPARVSPVTLLSY